MDHSANRVSLETVVCTSAVPKVSGFNKNGGSRSKNTPNTPIAMYISEYVRRCQDCVLFSSLFLHSKSHGRHPRSVRSVHDRIMTQPAQPVLPWILLHSTCSSRLGTKCGVLSLGPKRPRCLLRCGRQCWEAPLQGGELIAWGLGMDRWTEPGPTSMTGYDRIMFLFFAMSVDYKTIHRS